MKRAYYLPIALVVLAVAVSMPSLATQQVTVRGEVIDSVCFIKSGARGGDHRGCAQTCADNGIPLALLEEGTDQLIWLASSASMQSPNADLKAHASHTVEITGEYAERGGAKILVISEIKHISAN
ncbi:MAG: hypothetical protein CL485_06730 [Acidobacteria bacterium]|jgi:hypothetical protein|nr:hypothetical protein [Acidobacteriota bacterium]MEE3150801.1 hypothetical protein [Acidobacteriota bacterium]|tara:strand:+ start:5558 stop:5932 length:375 start_codon:yes stop_codon:yes gene_type:complete